MKLRIGLILLALAAFAAAPAAAKSYRAERYDASIRVLPGGHLEVTETVEFRFEEGTFERVFRDIPSRRTDQIEVLRATMDGREMPFGEGRDRVEVTRKSRVRVLWRFNPTAASTHTFTVTYRVNGVAYPTRDGDFVQWRALPNEHDYPIGRSTIEVQYPAALTRDPQVLTRRVEDFQIDRGDNVIRVASTGISKNGWVDVALTFERSAVAAAPAWYTRHARAQALAPRWIAAAGAIGLIGLVVLWALRQGYDAPSRDLAGVGDVAAAPDPLPPAIAGALASNGRPSIEHAMAALFGLADRGELEVREEAKGVFGQRNFTLVRRRTAALAAKHEQSAVEIAFKDEQRDEPSVSLNRVRARLTRHFGTFKKAIREEMVQAGLIDRDRQHVYARYGAVSLVILLLSLLAFGGMAVLVEEYQGWPMLIPAAMLVVALAGFIFQAATTPLSNEGVRRRERWRAYQKHLKEVAGQKRHLTTDSPAHVLPFAVSLGLAPAWAKFVQSHPVAAPAWFHAIAAHGDDGAFPAFIGAGGAASSGGASGGAGAGGGASGAS